MRGIPSSWACATIHNTHLGSNGPSAVKESKTRSQAPNVSPPWMRGSRLLINQLTQHGAVIFNQFTRNHCHIGVVPSRRLPALVQEQRKLSREAKWRLIGRCVGGAECEACLGDVANDHTGTWPDSHCDHFVLSADRGRNKAMKLESDLDVESSGAVAKGAAIDLVASTTTNCTAGVDLSARYIVDNNLAPVMSESYGACELEMGSAGNQFYKQLWQQTAAQGITVFVSTGDSGSAVCDQGAPIATQGLAVNGISSTPYNCEASLSGAAPL